MNYSAKAWNGSRLVGRLPIIIRNRLVNRQTHQFPAEGKVKSPVSTRSRHLCMEWEPITSQKVTYPGEEYAGGVSGDASFNCLLPQLQDCLWVFRALYLLKIVFFLILKQRVLQDQQRRLKADGCTTLLGVGKVRPTRLYLLFLVQ